MDKRDVEMLGIVGTTIANAIVLLARVVLYTQRNPDQALIELKQVPFFNKPRKTGAGDWNI
jgi:hypothetical protein